MPEKHKIFNSKNLHTIMDIFNIKRNIIQLRNLSLVSTFDISENYYTKKKIVFNLEFLLENSLKIIKKKKNIK